MLIVVGDDISTGDMAPDGAIAMSVWSNIAECARFVFRRLDPGFHDRARDWGAGSSSGGHDYGQCSSREQAALDRCTWASAPSPRAAVRTSAGATSSPSHRAPVIHDPDQVASVRVGDRWRIPGLAASLAAADGTVTAATDGGRQVEPDGGSPVGG